MCAKIGEDTVGSRKCGIGQLCIMVRPGGNVRVFVERGSVQ